MYGTLINLVVTCVASCWASVGAQQAAPLHVVRIAAGPSGAEEKGSFRFAEERSTFNRSSDREVIVLFQWDGVPGPHKLVARWRSPDGGFTSDSTIDYVARDRRFGAYWKIPIAPTMQLGTWSIEATVDGQPAGRFTFEITDAARPPSAPTKRVLSHAEIHERLTKDFVLLLRVGVDGRELEPGAGVIGAPGQVFTAVKLLDAVERVRGVIRGGVAVDLAQALGVNRQVGWAVLAAEPEAVPGMIRAGDPPKVGDRCYSMQGTAAGARILLEGQITGNLAGSASAGGWLVSFVNGLGSAGAPVANEYGEIIGVLGTTDAQRVLRSEASVIEFGTIPLVPMSAIHPKGSTAASFADLRERGDLLAPVLLEKHVVSGGFALGIDRGPIVRPDAQREEFSPKDKELVIFITWGPRDRLKGEVMFHVYDGTNRLIGSSKPKKVDLRKTTLVLSSWRIPVIAQPGTYRAEVHLDRKVAWRGYVRMTQ